MDICTPRSLNHLLLCGIRTAIENIFTDSAHKQKYILLNDTDIPSNRFQCKFPDILSVNQDCSILRSQFIEIRKQMAKGSLSSTDPAVRSQAIADAKAVMDFAAEIGCGIVTLWPGQDGYDYIFAADYIKERQLFADGVEELCRYRPEIVVTLEYKIKEPRTHSYISTVGTTLLMIERIGLPNLGIALDYGHAALGYETAAEAVAMCHMYGDRLKHIHINDNFRLWDDDMIVGTVHTLEYLEFFWWLKRTGYNGYLVIDQFPYREDGRDAVQESAAWLDVLQDAAARIDDEEAERVIAARDGVAASRFMRKILFGEKKA